jgi:hypothetical protein
VFPGAADVAEGRGVGVVVDADGTDEEGVAIIVRISFGVGAVVGVGINLEVFTDVEGVAAKVVGTVVVDVGVDFACRAGSSEGAGSNAGFIGANAGGAVVISDGGDTGGGCGADAGNGTGPDLVFGDVGVVIIEVDICVISGGVGYSFSIVVDSRAGSGQSGGGRGGTGFSVGTDNDFVGAPFR